MGDIISTISSAITWPSLAQVLFFAEGYQFFAHGLLLTGAKCMPLDFVEKIGLGFILHDVVTTAFAYNYTRKFPIIVGLHMLEHLYFLIRWNVGKFSRKFQYWVSYDWFQNNGSSAIEIWLGVFYDMSTHIFMMYALKDEVGKNDLIVTTAACALMYLLIPPTEVLPLVSPSSAPEWVKKRAFQKEEIYTNKKHQ
ncbi:Oidioi.mRNA.OKI2018_I69.chr2.g8396.t1.cds [Oikopleura dioica]|uniref:Oidioi.mRNA.OKI2018_I69.chr2.g8396.t1.cds n=1 Tax=Oikopleura dioica TaxID=34765 RepID=A0ABN7TFF0_OIKDI|nr:Oidioi.mRNA.OKI2018_I69.chr2.g8396.t1.cds [Oikopleura dioica]